MELFTRELKNSSDNSSCDESVNSNEDSAIEGETLKDRNRRLLVQERESQGRKRIRPSKRSGRYQRISPRLRRIKEEDGCNVEKCVLLEAISDCTAEVPEQRETTDDNRIWEIERMLKKRIVKRRQVLRVNSHSKSKKNRSDVNRRGVAEQSILHGVFSKIIVFIPVQLVDMGCPDQTGDTSQGFD